MNLKMFLSALLISTAGLAGQCEVSPYETVFYDFTQSPRELIYDAAKRVGCSNEQLNEIKKQLAFKSMTQLQHGASKYYSIASKGGIYQVITTSMSEPPRAVVMFSAYD